MGTGHRGSWTTLHSDRSEDVFDRLVFAMRLGAPDMPMDALFRYAVRTVDLVVQVGRLSQVPQGTPGSRKGGEPVRYLEGIYEVTDLESGNRVQLKPLYRYDPTLPEAPPRSGGRSRTAGGEKSEGGRKA